MRMKKKKREDKEDIRGRDTNVRRGSGSYSMSITEDSDREGINKRRII